MRRSELSSQEFDADFKFITSKVLIGHLGLIDNNNYVRIIPLNFVAIDKDIFFHGSLEGEKFELISKSPRASFSIDYPYSFIPSYFTSGKYACPATHFFKSIHIRGDAGIVSDIKSKALALQKLMEKYQGSKKHTAISHDLSLYRKALEEVGVYQLKSYDISIKIKFGQNERDETINQIILGLEQRGEDLDLMTIDEIRRLRFK